VIRLLKDADVLLDPLYRATLRRNHALIRQLGWGRASPVEQLNLVLSVRGAEDSRRDDRPGPQEERRDATNTNRHSSCR
jgi:hypothetical protein